MQDIKAFIENANKMAKEDFIKDAPNILKKAKEVGFIKVVKEFPNINQMIRDKMAEFEVDEAINLIKQFMPLLFDAMKDVIETSEDLKDEIEEIEDTTVSMVIEDGDLAMSFIIKDGKFDFKMEALEEADLVFKMNKDIMRDMIIGNIDPIQSYMSGDIKAQGNLPKAMALRSIFNTLGDEFGFNFIG